MKAADDHKKNLFSQNTNDALAILISSTKTKKRPVSLVDISKWLVVAVNKLGGYKEVADRLGLSTKMLRQFALVTHLQPEVQQLFKSRALDSIDAVVHLLLLSNKEQVIVANVLVDKKIDTKDLRAIVQVRKGNSKVPINKIIDEIIKTKTRKNYVVEFIIREGDSYTRLMKKFKRYISPNEIIRLDIEGSLGRLILTKNGKQELYRIAKNLNTRFQNVMPAILSR
jgi:hypothetical protein